MDWQFTYWAHSEYLQWYAEFGLFGGLLLAALGIWWLWSFICAMVNKKVLSAEASWACSLLALVWFVALFSRPFHRIENALWVAFAFAIINRELLPVSFKWSGIRHSSIYRALGVFMAAVSVAGLIFLYGGLRGDQYLRSSVRTNNAGLQAYKISQAMKMPMARDEAEEQYAYHLLAVANATHKSEDSAKAINQLYRSFTIRPQAKQLMELVRFAQQTGNQELLRRLVPYLKPGAFRVVPGAAQSQ
ncbi:MAG: O-antigen ligase family protein, partial [Synergistaceae bacterium]